MTPKYSVIIPIYNAENTLRRCVNSLLQQKYENMELILVNDGSTDGCDSICRELADRNRQITYICKANGGVSSARNAGLEIASGKYITFVDSDDTVAEEYFRILDSLDEQDKIDFIWFSLVFVSENERVARLLKPRIAEDRTDCAQVFSEALCNKSINSPCNKRYVRQLIEHNHFRFREDLSIGEDRLFNLQYALICKNCEISDEVLYYAYMDNQQSLSRKVREDLREQFQILDEAILHTVQTAPMEEIHRHLYIEAINFTKLRSVYSEAKRMHIQILTRKVRRRKLREMCVQIQFFPLPKGKTAFLLSIPVRMKWIAAIDCVGRYLAR